MTRKEQAGKGWLLYKIHDAFTKVVRMITSHSNPEADKIQPTNENVEKKYNTELEEKIKKIEELKETMISRKDNTYEINMSFKEEKSDIANVI